MSLIMKNVALEVPQTIELSVFSAIYTGYNQEISAIAS